MDDPQELFERMVEDLLSTLSANPAEAAKTMLTQQEQAVGLMTMLRMPDQLIGALLLDVHVAQLRAYKIKVEEALLASQAETNRNLAAALGMRDKS